MKIALDTNRYKDFCTGDAFTVEIVRGSESIAMPFIVIAELRAAFSLGSKGKENARVLSTFFASPRVSTLYADEATISHYAALFRQLRGQGTPIPVSAIWIAALCLQHDYELCTRDSHFDAVPQLRKIIA